MTYEESIKDWKIWYPYETFYIESLLTLTNRIINDYEYLNEIIKNRELLESSPLMLIDLAENIINLSASISRYLSPVKKDLIHTLRGEKLRVHLLIEPESILLSRDVRNFIEHFDENLDTFLQQPIAGNICPQRVIFNSSELDEVTFVFKCYIINECKYKTLNREIEILPIVKEICRIHNLLVEFSNSGGRLK